MAVSINTVSSSYKNSSTTSHDYGSMTIPGGSWGIFMVLAGHSAVGSQVSITAVEINGNACTKVCGIQDASDYSDRSFWKYDNTGGGDETGNVIATTDVSTHSCISVCEVSGVAGSVFGNYMTEEGYRNKKHYGYLAPQYAEGIIVGMGGGSHIGVAIQILSPATALHEIYNANEPWLLTGYQAYSGSGVSIGFDWNDAAAHQNIGDCLVEITSTTTLAGAQQIDIF